jgi:hypothetical protein
MRRSILRAGSFAVTLILGSVTADAQQGLPVEVQIDLQLLRIERAILAEDHPRTLELISELRAIDSTADVVELLFFEALAAMETGDLERAEAALGQFVTLGGRETPVYPRALEMLLDLPELREEARIARVAMQQAELERLREVERREQEEAERERQRLIQERRNVARAAERRVIPSLSVLRDVRFRLHSMYGNPLSLPVVTTLDDPFTDEEREWISRFARDANRAHLDIHLLTRLRALTPRSLATADPNAVMAPQEGQWYTRIQDSGTCFARTLADDFPEDSLYVVPHVTISFDRSWDRSWIGMGLLWPNTLRTDQPILLRAGASEHRLGLHESGRGIVPLDDWSAVTRALQSAHRFEISGIDQYTNQPLTIGFSASGFTNALRRIATECDRGSELRRWLR